MDLSGGGERAFLKISLVGSHTTLHFQAAASYEKQKRQKNRPINGVKFKWEDYSVERVLDVFLSVNRI
ncbi:hypothetical protein AV530_005366 [Patagioenas fasciata monilis]|uniref:Uncharacterized protein n=1 Tax=Patagioenas fasciata monilis TaxID=372326 RepID=A0A1V4JL14_PATFA|nr:hypothetical protein AV530_005366 [Patagioenas fasciata monilis]